MTRPVGTRTRRAQPRSRAWGALAVTGVAALVLTACGSEEPAPEPDPDPGDSEVTEDPAAPVETDPAEPSEPAEPTASGSVAPTDPAASADPDGEAEGVTVTDDVSGVSMTLPEEVEPNEISQPGPDGEEIALRSLTFNNGASEIGFNVIDLPAERYDLQGGLEGTATSVGGEIVSQEEIEVGGFPGLEAEIAVESDLIVYVQLISTDEYVVQPLSAGPTQDAEQIRADFDAALATLTLPE